MCADVHPVQDEVHAVFTVRIHCYVPLGRNFISLLLQCTQTEEGNTHLFISQRGALVVATLVSHLHTFLEVPTTV